MYLINKIPAVFWQKKNKITVLNPEDFEIPEFIKALQKQFNIDSDFFGTDDKVEIEERLEISKIILENKNFIEEIEKYRNFSTASLHLPSDANSFLHYYENNQNLYWSNVNKLLKYLDKYRKDSVRIEQFCSKLEIDRNLLMEKEKEFALEISKKLKDVTSMQGILKFVTDYRRIEIIDSAVFGRKMFNSSWKDGFFANIPSWVKNGFFRLIRLTDLIQFAANTIAFAKSKRSSVINHLPGSILQDINYGIMKKDAYYPTDKEYDLYFKYDKQGLWIQHLAITNSISDSSINLDPVDVYNEDRRYNGLSYFERKKLKKSLLGFRNRSRQIAKLEDIQRTIQNFEIHNGITVGHNGSFIHIKSENTDKAFMWYALDHLYNQHSETVFELLTARSYLNENLKQLHDIAKIVTYMKEISSKDKYDICIPGLSNNGTLFEGLVPLDILHKRRETKLIPFTLPSINGKILCLTGRHGGGKSVAGKSILTSVWLAQTGLPIFAKSFSTEVKSVIGSIVNDKGEGSTATIFVQKVKNILDGLAKTDPRKSIIFIDEIGKGTQETAGINLGKRILKTAKEKGYSVIFNSQILQLAEYSQNELGAQCFVVNKHHKFEAGIGDGQMEDLIKEKGLEQLLVK